MFVCKDQQQDQARHRQSNSGQIIHVDREDSEDLHRRRNRNSGQSSFTSTQRIKRICIVQGAAPRSSTFTDTRCSISCYFDLSSLQSRVVPVWGWLSLGVFEYRKSSPGGLQVRVGGRTRRRFERSSAGISSRIDRIIVRGSRRASTSCDGEREVVHFGTRTYRTSSTIRSTSYISSL